MENLKEVITEYLGLDTRELLVVVTDGLTFQVSLDNGLSAVEFLTMLMEAEEIRDYRVLDIGVPYTVIDDRTIYARYEIDWYNTANTRV